MSRRFLILSLVLLVAMVAVVLRPSMVFPEKRITGNTADEIGAEWRAMSEGMGAAELAIFQKGMKGFFVDHMDEQIAARMFPNVKDAEYHLVKAMRGRTRGEIIERGRRFDLEPKSPMVRVADEQRAWLESRVK